MIFTKSATHLNPLTISPKSGIDAFTAFLATLQPKDGGREIWIKHSHDRFYVGRWDASGRFTIQRTKQTIKNTPSSRVRSGIASTDAFSYLSQLCQNEDGGLFYIPTQPQDLPTADCVSATDDIGVELDEGTRAEQLEKYQLFTAVTGLTPSALISSGGKSVHGHYKIDAHIPLEQANYLRRLVCLALQSDPVTVRPHQPMRIPGFFRKEKGQEQELLFSSQNRYSYDAIVAGLAQWFESIGLPMPDRFSDDYWREFHRLLKPSNKDGEAEKQSRIKALILQGCDGWEVERDRITAQKQAEREQRQRQSQRSQQWLNAGERQISELVDDACDRLGADGFNLFNHGWTGNAEKSRGCCPWHQSSTGNSAWISNHYGAMRFACYSCTDNRLTLDAFGYWLGIQQGTATPTYPSGKAYVDAANDFLALYGFARQETAEGRESNRQTTAEEWRHKHYSEQLVNGFAQQLERLLKGKKRQQRERVKPIAVESIKVPYIVGQLPQYQPGAELPIFEIERSNQQNTFYSEAHVKGWGHILNGSQPGVGKSHEVGNLRADMFAYDEPDDEGKPVRKTPTLHYFSQQSRLPSTATVEQNFSEVTIRHNGMVVDADCKTPLGNDYLRMPKEGETAQTRSNCHRSHLFVAAASKGLPWASKTASANPICEGCEFHKKRVDGAPLCSVESGDGYGYRFERREDFESKELRMNPASAPDLESGSGAIAIWEEASQLLVPEIRTGQKNDLETQFGSLEDSTLTDIYDGLAPFRKAVRAMLNETKRYGWSKAEILEKLGTAPDWLDPDTLKQIQDAITPTVEAVLDNGNGIDISDLSVQIQSLRGKIDRRTTKKKPLAGRLAQVERELRFGEKDVEFNFSQESVTLKAEKLDLEGSIAELEYEIAEMGDRLQKLEDERAELKKIGKRVNWQGRIDAEQELKNTPTQLLVDMLGIWAGCVDGAMRINGSQITLTLPNRRLEQLTKGARTNIYLDATISPRELAAKIGVAACDVLHFEVKQEPVNNVQRFQVGDFGKNGRDRAVSTDERLKHAQQGILQHASAILGKPVEDIPFAIADYKGEKADLHGAQIRHMSNSRGTNEVEGVQVLIIQGLPKPNMGAIADEYECLNCPGFGFEQFYQGKADAEIIQEDGRNRARRFPTIPFLIYYITDEALPFETTPLKARDLSWDAAPKGEQTARSIVSALASLVESSVKLTQKALAAAVGVTQGFLSRWFADHGGWDWWKKNITNSYKESIGTSNIFDWQFEKLLPGEPYIAETLIPQMIESAETEPDEAIAILDLVTETMSVWGKDGFERMWLFIPIACRNKIIAAMLKKALTSTSQAQIFEVWQQKREAIA